MRKQVVRVLTMHNPHRADGTRANDATAARLREADVDVHWTSPLFAVTREESMEAEAIIQRAMDAAGQGNSGVPGTATAEHAGCP